MRTPIQIKILLHLLLYYETLHFWGKVFLIRFHKKNRAQLDNKQMLPNYYQKCMLYTNFYTYDLGPRRYIIYIHNVGKPKNFFL